MRRCGRTWHGRDRAGSSDARGTTPVACRMAHGAMRRAPSQSLPVPAGGTHPRASIACTACSHSLGALHTGTGQPIHPTHHVGGSPLAPPTYFSTGTPWVKVGCKPTAYALSCTCDVSPLAGSEGHSPWEMLLRHVASLPRCSGAARAACRRSTPRPKLLAAGAGRCSAARARARPLGAPRSRGAPAVAPSRCT
jgi:hypothetical protein